MMKSLRVLMSLAALGLLVGPAAGQITIQFHFGGDEQPAPPVPVAAPDLLPDYELDQLMGSIALYPDSLIAQILPACTYPYDVQDAMGWLNANPQPAEWAIDQQNWDPSIKALVHYPPVLQMLAEHPDWAQAVGAAFVNQQDDVMASIQRLRRQAMAAGNLVNTPEQTVIVDEYGVHILPAEQDVIYVPQYDPIVIYERQPYRPILFSAGFRIGRWLDYGCDWRDRCIVVGGGWHYGWRYHDRKWQRDERRDRRDWRPPPTWTHDARKPRPTLPEPLAHRDWRHYEAPPRPAAQVKPFELPRRPEQPQRGGTVQPPANTFDNYQSPAEVRRDVDRYRQSREHYTAPPQVTPTPAAPQRTAPPPTYIQPTRRTSSYTPAAPQPSGQPATPRPSGGPAQKTPSVTPPAQPKASAATPRPTPERIAPSATPTPKPAPAAAPAPKFEAPKAAPATPAPKAPPSERTMPPAPKFEAPKAERPAPAPRAEPKAAPSPSRSRSDDVRGVFNDNSSSDDAKAQSSRGHQSMKH